MSNDTFQLIKNHNHYFPTFGYKILGVESPVPLSYTTGKHEFCSSKNIKFQHMT